MQNRHLDRYSYFCELAKTSQDFYLSYLGKFVSITPETKILEIGCGEGGNLVPFAQIGCSVTGIDICSSRITEALDFFFSERAVWEVLLCRFPHRKNIWKI